MAWNARRNRFTVYDVAEARGDFAANTANADSPGYVGPLEYPKMLYHPKGEEKIVRPAEIVELPGGRVREVGEQRELVYVIVNNAEEEKMMLAEGWHEHPAQAMEAAGKKAPPTGAAQQLQRLQREKELLERQLAEMQKQLGTKPILGTPAEPKATIVTRSKAEISPQQ